jgi:hypothetical protein
MYVLFEGLVYQRCNSWTSVGTWAMHGLTEGALQLQNAIVLFLPGLGASYICSFMPLTASLIVL